ncbi:MAG: hypothetical protein GXO27_06465 [Chlorobi bacterium]|nr:hypothetical protein [Chlorobiota bacterium]
MKKKYYIITLIMILISLLINLEYGNEEIPASIHDKLSNFPSKVRNHFKNLSNNYYYLPVFNDYAHDVTNILVAYRLDSLDYHEIKDSIEKISLAKYHASDSCVLVVNMYSNENNYFSSYKTKDTGYLKKKCLKNKLPIPNFWAMDYKTQNLPRLPEEFNIYVFEASDKPLGKKYISKNVYMPDYWQHGYSRGVALNDKTGEIIYWFVLW